MLKFVWNFILKLTSKQNSFTVYILTWAELSFNFIYSMEWSSFYELWYGFAFIQQIRIGFVYLDFCSPSPHLKMGVLNQLLYVLHEDFNLYFVAVQLNMLRMSDRMEILNIDMFPIMYKDDKNMCHIQINQFKIRTQPT